MAETVDVKTGNVTVFGTETEFSGELDFTDNLVIGGAFKGIIRSGGNLEIAKTASCSVDSITTKSIVVSGQVNGNIQAPDRVEMRSGCKIVGDLTTSRLRIADNVDFHGQVTMLERTAEVPPDIFALDPGEYKQTIAGESGRKDGHS
ncbi:MAG: polymer-forming cytoskeletal protein [Spirochaetaceae bacterium]|jgi:cytoskeletal protein CcmA (bactofilin family)|nr:polymer-forming cytoskeletal protein [Spirochaetaceae bacterium]